MSNIQQLHGVLSSDSTVCDAFFNRFFDFINKIFKFILEAFN